MTAMGFITNAVIGIAEVVAIGDTKLPKDGVDGLVSRMQESMTQYLCQACHDRRLLFSVILLALAHRGECDGFAQRMASANDAAQGSAVITIAPGESLEGYCACR